MQIKTSSGMCVKPQAILTDDALTIPPRTTKAITISVDYPSEWSKRGTVTLLGKFLESAGLLISHSMSTTFDNKMAV